MRQVTRFLSPSRALADREIPLVQVSHGQRLHGPDDLRIDLTPSIAIAMQFLAAHGQITCPKATKGTGHCQSVAGELCVKDAVHERCWVSVHAQHPGSP